MNRFERKLVQHRLFLRRGRLQVLQVNVGRKCNQTCRHCHVNAAAAVASSELPQFLHADTWPPEGYAGIIRGQLNRPALAAGAFSFTLRGQFAGRGLVERLVAVRCRCFKNPFGDQGLFLRRALFEAVGGFADWVILEDVEMLRRLKRCGQVVIVGPPAATSCRRWRTLGPWRAFWVNQLVLAGYACGVSKDRLATLYQQARRHGDLTAERPGRRRD